MDRLMKRCSPEWRRRPQSTAAAVALGDGDVGGVDGDGSRGNYPSRQGAGTETYVPRNLSSMPAELRNFSWMEARVFDQGFPEIVIK